MVNPFDRQIQRKIVEAITRAECKTSGEIRVHVKSKCGPEPMKQAQKVFSRLGMHQTKDRNGVLIFVAWKSRQFAIIGDKGIDQQVGDLFWNQTRDAMSHHFSKNDFAGGIVAGIQSVGEKLKAYFPAQVDDKNELSNTLSQES